MVKFKVGNEVLIRKDCKTNGWSDYAKSLLGKKTNISRIGDTGTIYLDIDDRNYSWDSGELKFLSKGRRVKKSKPKTKFIIHGEGCNNLSEMIFGEQDLKEQLLEKKEDNDWTGRIVGYKLVPVYEVETKVKKITN